MLCHNTLFWHYRLCWDTLSFCLQIQLYEVFRSETKIYLILEYAPNGDILSYINECVLETGCAVDEGKSRELFRQIVAGVSHCHQLNVVHRYNNLKTSGILGQGGRVAPLTAKKLPKIGEKTGKSEERDENWGNREKEENTEQKTYTGQVLSLFSFWRIGQATVQNFIK